YEPETGGPGRRASVLSDRADALPAVAADARELPSINGVAARVELGAVDEFWSHIEGAAQDELLATSSRAAGAPIEKVWLDGKVVPTLDDSRGQIGVPEAWDLGFDGSGVTVAVLDTGYDPDHPDL